MKTIESTNAVCIFCGEKAVIELITDSHKSRDVKFCYGHGLQLKTLKVNIKRFQVVPGLNDPKLFCVMDLSGAYYPSVIRVSSNSDFEITEFSAAFAEEFCQMLNEAKL